MKTQQKLNLNSFRNQRKEIVKNDDFLESKKEKDRKYANTPQAVYPALELLEDLRQEVERIAPTHIVIDGKRVKTLQKGKLSENKLGIFLGKKNTYIKNTLKRQLSRNPAFIISLDVLEGYKQDIVVSHENESLVIGNLIVRDYPMILRIKK